MTRDAYGATRWGAPAHADARCLARPPPRGPNPEATRKTCTICGSAQTRVFYSYKQEESTPHTAPRGCKRSVEARWNRASSEEKLDYGTENAEGSAQGATEDAEPAKATSFEPENAQPTRSEGREGSPEKADGPERGTAQEIAGEGQPIAGYGDAVGPEQSGTVKTPNAE